MRSPTSPGSSTPRTSSRSSESSTRLGAGSAQTTRARIVGRKRTQSGRASGTSLSTPEEVPGPRRGADQGGRAASCPRWSACASAARAPRSATCSRTYSPKAATPTRCARSARSRLQGRLENLEELVGVAREYDASADEPSLEEFLQQIALFSDQDTLRSDEGIVTLMTLHNAKGLEFPVVFIIGCEEGVFPHMRSIEAGDLDEERRLCYVGITRARRELYLTYARQRSLYGQRDWNVPSRFVDEIPVALTDGEPRAPGGRDKLGTLGDGSTVTGAAFQWCIVLARRRCDPRLPRRRSGGRVGTWRRGRGALRQ